MKEGVAVVLLETVLLLVGFGSAIVCLTRGQRRLAWTLIGVGVVATLGFTFVGLVSEAVVTETVFSLPGVGRLVVQSILRRDYPVIQGVILVIVVFYIVVNLVVDIVTTYLDPRVKLS